MSHDYVSTHCLNCGGFLGDVCVDCGHVSDGGDFMASQSDAWCHCNNSTSDFGCDAYGQPLDDDDAEHSVQATVASPWACPSCSHENHAMAIKCYFCDATAPNA